MVAIVPSGKAQLDSKPLKGKTRRLREEATAWLPMAHWKTIGLHFRLAGRMK
jgi:hypothetical protein